MDVLSQHTTREIAKSGGLPALLLICALLVRGAVSPAQEMDVSGRIELQSADTKAKVPHASGAVVWLTRVAGAPDNSVSRAAAQASGPLRLTQRNKSFEPRLLVVPVGAAVEFPNRDPFFHNVFSLFEGKRFDLGLYEAGTTRNVHFDRPGISYIFCNIHPEMSAVVIALDTPYYGISDEHGDVVIPGLPPGQYVLHVWHQSSATNALSLTRRVTVSQADHSFGLIRLAVTNLQSTHKNKYGRDYDRPTPASPVYERP